MQLEVGSILEGKVSGLTKFGAFVDLGEGKTGLVHISEVSSTYVKEITDFLSEGQAVKVKVIAVGEDGKISLSIKKAESQNSQQNAPKKQSGSAPAKSFVREKDYSRSSEPMSFEDMMNKFKQSSDERMSDLKRSMDNKRGSYSMRASKK